MSKPARSTSAGRGSSSRRRSGRGAERADHRSARRTARRRNGLSFVDMLLISAVIVVALFVAVVVWIVLRGMF